MAGTKWSGKGDHHSWFDAANWKHGVPVAQEAAVFSDGHSWAISLAGTADATVGEVMVLGDSLTFSAGALDLAAAQPKQGYPVDLAIGRNGSVTIAAGATITSHYSIDVGSVVAGALTAGNLVVQGTLDGAFLDVIDGSASVSGAGAHVALIYDGYSGVVADGSLTISAGGTYDVGPDSLANNYSALNIGGGTGDGSVLVSDIGSVLSLSGLIFGNNAVATLDVRNGGTVRVNYVTTQGYGEAHISVEGAGSVLTADRGISIGDDDSLSGLTLSVLQGGSVSAGTYGLSLTYGALVLDASAHFDGSIVSQVGQIAAVAASAHAPGTVTLSGSILLTSNQGAQGQFAYDTTAYSSGGAVLKLDGAISSIDSATLLASSGQVVLDNGANDYTATSIYGARLEIAVTGAAGAGAMRFVGNAAQMPVLQIDAGVDFTNIISGLGGHDMIDLRGFAFGHGVTDSFAGGTLTLTNSHTTTSLALAGSYTTASFILAGDSHGGTAITFAHG